MINALLNLKKYDEVLGINKRNQEYIRPFNSLAARKIADNKLLAKRVLSKLNISTPELYKVIRSTAQLNHIDWESLPNSFVIKPNRGSLGSGIQLFYGKKKHSFEWIRPNGQTMDTNSIILHMEKILEGRFSMGDNRDVVIIEERVKTHPTLKRYSYKGVPDIRLIVFNHVPVMAMIRLPTKRSDGKANLHAGGICAGLDIASGVTTHAMHLKDSSVIEDTYESLEYTLDLKENLPLSGIKVPFWDEILEIAVRCQDASGLGYLGVDIVIDRDKGPMVLEINARPGLGIQSANNAGLKPRLERVKGLKIKSVKHGIRVAKDLFGGEVEGEIEVISGKKVVNLVEKVTVTHRSKQAKKETVNAMLDTGITTSRIDIGLAGRMGYTEAISSYTSADIPESFPNFSEAEKFITKHEAELTNHPDIIRLAKIAEDGKATVKPVISIDIRIAGVKKKIEAVISTQTDMLYPILVGRKELKDYLIDASRTFTR